MSGTMRVARGRQRLTFLGNDKIVPMAKIHTDNPAVLNTGVVKCLSLSDISAHPRQSTRPTHPGTALNRNMTAIFNPPSRTTCASNA